MAFPCNRSDPKDAEIFHKKSLKAKVQNGKSYFYHLDPSDQVYFHAEFFDNTICYCKSALLSILIHLITASACLKNRYLLLPESSQLTLKQLHG